MTDSRRRQANGRSTAAFDPNGTRPFWLRREARDARASPLGIQRRAVHGHSVIADVSTHHRPQPLAHFRDGVVQTSLQFGSHRLDLRLPPLAHRLPQHREPSFSGFPADVREAQKVEALRFPVATVSPILVRIAAKFDEPRFLGMQLKAKLRESFADFREESLGLLSMLEPNDEVIGETHDDHVTLRLRLSPLLDPKVEYVVQIDVGQKRRNAAALDSSYFTAHSLPILQHAGGQPFLNQPHDALVRDSVLDEFHQPFVGQASKKSRMSAIEHPVHLLRQ
jgi:hypothetical protein